MPRDYNKRSFPPERKDDISSVRFQTMLGMATKGFPLNIAMAAVMGIFNLRSTQIRTDLRKNVQKYFSNKHQISVRKIRSIDSVEKLSEIPVEDNMTAQVVESIRQYVGAHGSCYLVECKGQHQYFLFRTDQDGKKPKGVKTVFGFLEGHMNQYNQLVAGSEATISRKGSWNASEVEPKIEQARKFYDSMQGLKPFYTSRGFKFFREGRRLASLEKALQGYKPSRVEPSNSRRPDFRF